MELKEQELKRICEALVYIVNEECYTYGYKNEVELAEKIIEYIDSKERRIEL